MTSATWRDLSVSSMLLQGNGVSQIVRDRGQRIRRMWPLNATRVRPKRNAAGELIYEVTQKDGKKLVRDIRCRRKKLLADLEARIDKRLDGRVGKILEKVKTPAKKQFDKLNSGIESLTKKLDKWLLNGTKTKAKKTKPKKASKAKTKKSKAKS